jgi:hypothetical protein
VIHREHDPHKKRISGWTNPGLLGIGVVLLMIGTPMVLWLMTYHSDAAVAMFIITWLSLTFVVLLRAKNAVSDPGYYVDNKVVNKTRQEIEAQRRLTRTEFLKNELEALRRGEKSPVLDIWRLDESLARRHPYFSSTTSLLLDPQQKELQVRIQIGEMGAPEEAREPFLKDLFMDLLGYLRIVCQDPFLLMLKEFFDVYILQIDALRENEQHIDTPYPVLSVSMKASSLWSLSAVQKLEKRHLFGLAEVRFADGNEVGPHRVIDLPSVRGLK